MYTSLSRGWAKRQAATNLLLRFVLLAVCVGSSINQQTLAQSKPSAAEVSSLCNRDNASETIRQQIDASKTIDEPVRRIAVLTRAADVLWPFKREEARAAFIEAFDVAIRNESENENEKRESWQKHRALILLDRSDQRYVVIRAVAKRDAAWAKKLTAQVLELDRQASDQTPGKDSFHDLLTALRLLDSATQLIATDVKAAIELARNSLGYPATHALTRFLYALAGVDQRAANQFYTWAVMAYADRPMREFLYLATYPFAFRSSGDTPVFGFYNDIVPANFALNDSLQRQFTQTLVRRAQKALEVPLDEGDNFNGLPGTGHIWQTLMRIEPPVRERLPDLLEAVIQAREKIFVTLTVETQKALVPAGRNEVSPSPAKTFGERIETAEKTPGVNVRDDLLVEAIMSSSAKEDLKSLLSAAEKITDSNLRDRSLEWLYFRQANEAAVGKDFAGAEKLAAKVEAREQRAFLLAQIAKGLLNRTETQAHAREVLDDAISEAKKAGMTIFAARALLTASNLYLKLDLGRSIAILGDAINCINRLEDPDFSVSNQVVVKEVRRKSNPGRFIFRFFMPGLDPETAFRELAKIDFNDALTQTSALNDKFQRALATLAVADICLQETERRRSDRPKK